MFKFFVCNWRMALTVYAGGHVTPHALRPADPLAPLAIVPTTEQSVLTKNYEQSILSYSDHSTAYLS